MSTRTIRPAELADIEPLQRLDRASHGSAWSRRTFQDEIERRDRIHLVATTRELVIGHASLWLDRNVGRITNVAVDPASVGHGHASALLVDLLRRTLELSTVSSLQLEVRPSNRRAQRLYNRFGFMPVGVERDFYDTADSRGGRDALVMTVADVCQGSWRDRLVGIENSLDPGAAA